MGARCEFRSDAWSWTLTSEKVVRYDVRFADGILDPGNGILAETVTDGQDGPVRRFVLVDKNVDRLYGADIRAYFHARGTTCEIFALPVSEQDKTMASVTAVVDALDAFGIDRREPIVAIGGGVLLDIAGIAASLYRRGTPYIRVPTTLVGMIDAGVGAKTGVNHDRHKNRLGAYHPPKAVLLDRAFLKTLDERHLVNGVAEIIKLAIMRDARLFEILEKHGVRLIAERFHGETEATEKAAGEVLRRAVAGMLDELAGNLWESDLERLVDFGHSISPLIEMLALPELLHGEAVALDMALFVVVSCRRGLVSIADRDRMLALMRRIGLPVCHALLDLPVLRRALADTTRHRGGLPRLPIPETIGTARFLNDVTDDELAVAAKELRETEGEKWGAA